MSDYKAFLCISFLTFVLGCLLGFWAGMIANLFRGVSSSPSSEATVVNSSAAVRLFTVTAYCPCKLCCGRWADGITASGIKAEGLIVAAPSTIPFGTVLDIPGYGVASVQDRGGAIIGDKIDVLFSTHQAALEWSVQELMVTIY